MAPKTRIVQRESGIPDERVFNIDVTSSRMLPVRDVGRGTVLAFARSGGGSRVQRTVALALPMLPGKMFAQILSFGLTQKVTPIGPQPRGIVIDHTHNHWQTVFHW